MRISLLDSYKRGLVAFQLKLKFLEGLSHSATNAFCHSDQKGFVILNEVMDLTLPIDKILRKRGSG